VFWCIFAYFQTNRKCSEKRYFWPSWVVKKVFCSKKIFLLSGVVKI
jgi:hypothetical protein